MLSAGACKMFGLAVAVLIVSIMDAHVAKDELYQTTEFKNSGGGGQGWSYVIIPINMTYVQARNGTTGNMDYSGSPSFVLNSCIRGLPRHGGTLFLKAGIYNLSETVVIDRSSVEIRGENMGGDLFFTSDSYYNGFSNKTATLIVAQGFDAFRVGDSKTCRTPRPGGGYFMNGTHCLIFGTSFANMGISGFLDVSDAMLPPTGYTNGSGIRIQKADTIRFENLDIRRKEYGLNFGQNQSRFEYDHVIDVVTVNNLYLAFNKYGLYQTGWTSNVRIRNIFGYINERSLIHAETKYDWLIDGVMSQDDGNFGSEVPTDAPIYIYSRQDVTIRHVTIAANIVTPVPTIAVPLIYISLGIAKDATGEWYRGDISFIC
eukprot:m.45970 g.45970  ORF g.45970 m.45970 type:complete len:373 (-) comp10317_c1_seq1:34-1152(-)